MADFDRAAHREDHRVLLPDLLPSRAETGRIVKRLIGTGCPQAVEIQRDQIASLLAMRQVAGHS
jgi:hypothetical protein